MSDYGVTEKGFVLKRMDTILEEVHADLSSGFGVDTRLSLSSFLDTLVTTFCGQIADLWEVAQNNYYSMSPATAEGINLDNAVQYGGITRKPNRQSCYPLHCTGDDGTVVRTDAMVATDTKPEIRLYAAEEFTITREKFNKVGIVVAAIDGQIYSISINGEQFNYVGNDSILEGLKSAITNEEYIVTIQDDVLTIEDTITTRSNILSLSDNLTTDSVTVIENFLTEDYGKITIPNGLVTKMVNNITGFTAVTNILEPIYGRLAETDVELRQSYIAKSSLRSSTMLDSIVAELLNNVQNVEAASGYENDSDTTDERGLPPHSIEIVVEGGDNSEIAEAILNKKAGGIQTFGSIEVAVPGKYGDSIMIRFNRPEYLYVWLKVVLHGNTSAIPANYSSLVTDSIVSYSSGLITGDYLLTQKLNEGIYDTVSGVTYIEILTAYTSDKTYIPAESDYVQQNVIASSRQKILIDATRIEVTVSAD